MHPPSPDHLCSFFAEHAAVFYYWVIILMFFASPSAAYVFSELVEVCCVLRDRLSVPFG